MPRLLPLPQNRQLFRGMEPVLHPLRRSQGATEAAGKAVHCVSGHQMVLLGPEDAGGGLPAGDRVGADVLEIGPGQGLTELSGNLSLGLQA